MTNILQFGLSRPSVTRAYLLSIGCILVFSIAGKSIALIGDDVVLHLVNPVLAPLINAKVYLITTVGEIAVLFVLVRSRAAILKLALVLSTSCVFVSYRLALGLIGNQAPCNCLGRRFGDAIASTLPLNSLLLGMLAYMLLGSSALLVWHWRSQSVRNSA